MRVLVVEDDRELGAEVVAGLRAVGYAVDRAEGLREAEFKTSVNRYNCLIVDRGLPDGDGLMLVRHLRAAGSVVPVLVLTARDAVADRVAGFAEGGDDYLVKPFAFAELVARVAALCRRAGQARPVVVRLGDLVLDEAARRVTRHGVLLPLTAKEFAVMEVLMTRAGQVTTRSDLIECCWDEMAEPMSNVVDAVVVQLRRKLGPPPVLRTVRGVGFVLDVNPGAGRGQVPIAGVSVGG